MKKVLSVVLVCALLLTMAVPAVALTFPDPIRDFNDFPVILLTGDSREIVDADDNHVFQMNDLLSLISSDDEDDGDNSETLRSVANVLKPFLWDGLVLNKWEPYYENLQKEIGDLFEKVALDENGDPKYGTQNSPGDRASNERSLQETTVRQNGYQFFYDWRLDPYRAADELNDFINTMLENTGKDRVGLLGSCLGASVVFAYIERYGADKLNGIGIDATIANGSEFISEAISGNFHLDGKAISRMMADYDLANSPIGDFALKSVDLVTEMGVLDAVTGLTRKTIYKKVVEGVTSALALGTFFTMPCYWTGVQVKDFETAKNYVFGPEGSEKRKTYAKLIEQLDYYNEHVSQELMKKDGNVWGKLTAKNANFAVIAKYGFQQVPICMSSDVLGDQFASVKNASFGATTSTLDTTLSEDYIAQRVAEGKGKYISPDKKIDASTCLFPDRVWFTKGASHSDRTQAEDDVLLAAIVSQEPFTIDDTPMGQFMVYHNGSGMTKMTAENADTEKWAANAGDESGPKILRSVYQKLIVFWNWLVALFNLFKK